MSDIIRRLKCNQPVKSASGGKKFVVKACKQGDEKIVRFGDASMGHYREGDSKGGGHGNEGRRANFKSRHNCGDAKSKDRFRPKFWSCNWSW
jgi:hypothetical protein